jgi:putative peptidoglycan lipid II flippase
VIFLFLSQGLIDVIFKRGEFSLYSLKITSSVLFFYSFGLFFFCTIKLLVNAFYSLKDTVTPAKTTTIALVLNIVLSAILIFPLKIGGVALGSSLAAAFNSFLLYRYLIKRMGPIDWEDTKSQFVKVLILSFVTAIAAWLIWNNLMLNKYLRMAIAVVVSSCVFILGGYILRIKQIKYIKDLILNNER